MVTRLASTTLKKSKNLAVQGAEEAKVISNDEGLNVKLLHLQSEVETLKEMLSNLVGKDQINDVLVDEITISPGDNFIGTNWHNVEISNEGKELRWTGPGALATFKLPLSRRKIQKAVFTIYEQINGHNNIEKIRIFVDGDEITPLFKDLGRIEFIIPNKKYVFSFTEIGILTNGTHQNKDTEGKILDSRWLGCAFKELTISTST